MLNTEQLHDIENYEKNPHEARKINKQLSETILTDVRWPWQMKINPGDFLGVRSPVGLFLGEIGTCSKTKRRLRESGIGEEK